MASVPKRLEARMAPHRARVLVFISSPPSVDSLCQQLGRKDIDEFHTIMERVTKPVLKPLRVLTLHAHRDPRGPVLGQPFDRLANRLEPRPAEEGFGSEV